MNSFPLSGFLAASRPALRSSVAFVLLLGLAALGDSRVHVETTAYSGATEIDSLPYEITQSGAYYLAQDFVLTENINGIHVAASNVTIDFNGHTISQTYGVNINTDGVGIDGNNVTVINGNVDGFRNGIDIGNYSHACYIEDMCLSGSTIVGIGCYGNNNLIRRCRVYDTGGNSVNGGAFAAGVQVCAAPNAVTGNRVIDCDISMSSAGTGVTWPVRFGIQVAYTTDALLVGNRINGYDCGIWYYSATGKYRDNTVSSVGTPYTSGTDAGGNN
jgi:hypothetical protein